MTGHRLDAKVGHGVAMSEAGRKCRLGWPLTSAVRDKPGFEIGLEGARTDSANDNEPVEHPVMLEARCAG